jgi:NRAMP (natural resistance-associated macrophage protein)-like metal ion transporter
MSLRENRFFKKLFIFFAIMGPGIITASVGNNSAGIATYSLAGGHYGYSLLFSFIPMCVALILAQEMSARMAVATGKGLADLIRENYGVKVTFYLMLVLFFTNLSCLIAEFSGVAASLEIFNIHKNISLPLAALFVWLLIVKGNYKTVEKVFLVLSLGYVFYLISGFMSKPQWTTALHQTFLPQFDFHLSSSAMLIGMIGTTITPWMQFYLQSSIVEKRVGMEEYKHVRLDVVVGCIISCIVAYFIVVACAATIFKSGIQISTVQDAAMALEPLVGRYASLFFAFGIFNAAIFAVSILPLSTAYTICEGMGWEEGVDKRFEEAPQFFSLYTFMIVIAAGIVMIPHFPLLKMMYFSQIGNGILLPVILIFMLSLVNNKDIMGEHVNSKFVNIFSWITILIIIALSLSMVLLGIFVPTS